MRSKIFGMCFRILSVTQDCLLSSSKRKLGVYTGLVKSASHHQSLSAHTDSKRVKQFSSASYYRISRWREGDLSSQIMHTHTKKKGLISSVLMEDLLPTATHKNRITTADLDITAWYLMKFTLNR